MSLLKPEGDYFIDGYMGKFSFVIESEDIIVTAFYDSAENIGTPTINIYSFVEVMFHYKGLHQVLFPSILVIWLSTCSFLPNTSF
jgi:hypothetical protein